MDVNRSLGITGERIHLSIWEIDWRNEPGFNGRFNGIQFWKYRRLHRNRINRGWNERAHQTKWNKPNASDRIGQILWFIKSVKMSDLLIRPKFYTDGLRQIKSLVIPMRTGLYQIWPSKCDNWTHNNPNKGSLFNHGC